MERSALLVVRHRGSRTRVDRVNASQAAAVLYGLAPQAFTARRDALAKQARADGDRSAASQIAALRKPTVVAWLANQLSRRHPDEVGPLLELGEALREATATLVGPELRRLAAERQRLVHALVEQARALGKEEGQRVTEDVARGLEETFHATLADPGAAQQLLDARLTNGLSHQGYDLDTMNPAPPAARSGPKQSSRSEQATRKAAPARPSAESRRRAEQRSRLEHDLGEAWATARRTADSRDEATAEAGRTRRARSDTEREVTRLRDELADAEAASESIGKADATARRARERADRAAQKARQRVTELQARLDDL